MRVDERRLAAHHVDSIARQLVGDDRPLTRYDFIYARKQLRYGRPLHGPRAAAIGTRRGGGEVQHCLAKGLARDRAGGETGSPDRGSTLDEGNALAQLRRLNGAALARRTTANADEIVVEGVAH